MLIREEREGDEVAIADVTARAFAGKTYSDQTEPMIIERLRATEALTISLVAYEAGILVGHVAFSPVTIDRAPGLWFGLGPVSVDPSYQGRGIGTALIREGLDQLRARAAAGCVVLGDPAYYRRFGFKHDVGLRYEDAPPEYFMRISLNGDDPPKGRVDYASAFSG
jgi:putative acetyltransferase